jgi:hypothetical protein
MAEPTTAPQSQSKHRHLVWLGVFAGLLLALIGVRFMLVPRTAANNFGLAKDVTGFELHYVVGLRDVWLGLLAVAFAALREWRALALWLALGALVCFADAVVVATATGKPLAIAFHAGSGAFCALLALAVARRWRRDRAMALDAGPEGETARAVPGDQP